MASERELCPQCGQLHDRPFSDRVLAIYQKLKTVTDEDERGSLILTLVTEFVEDFDCTDEDLSDHIHDMVDEVIATRLEHQQAAMRLGRTLMRSLHNYSRGERERLRKRPVKVN